MEANLEPPVSARFSAPMARWVSAAMAKDDIRYYLNGLHCQPVEGGGVFIVGTDGSRMLVAFDKDGRANKSFVFEFHCGAIAACSKSLVYSNRRSGQYITVEGARLMVLDQASQELFVQPGKCLIEAVYPKWESVAPPRDRAQLVPAGDTCFQHGLLAGMTKHLPTGNFMSNGVYLWRRAGLDPKGAAMYVEFSGLPLLGVVMPLRDCGAEHFWLK